MIFHDLARRLEIGVKPFERLRLMQAVGRKRWIEGASPLALAIALVLLAGVIARAEDQLDAKDSATIRNCLSMNSRAPVKLHRDHQRSLPDEKKMQTTADMVSCGSRERAVWESLLNDTYRKLRHELTHEQQIKLRHMQEAWVASRKRSCDFYWDLFQGTIASPMIADCFNRATARRALLLREFLDATR
jgi:uncharacterized protein YecT (DUF1311 family)